MIRIIDKIWFENVEEPGIIRPFPLVPASGTYKNTVDADDGGTFRTVEISFRIYHPVPGMTGNLRLWVSFDSGRRRSVGTEDLPVRLKTEEDSALKLSCKWQVPVR